MKIWGLILAGALIWGGSLLAENNGAVAGDPSDLWYRGFLMTKSAEEFREKGDRLAAFNKLDEVFEIYKDLSLNHPDFHKELVNLRLRLTSETRHRLRREIENSSPFTEKLKTGLDREMDDLKERVRILEEEMDSLAKRKTNSDGKPELPGKKLDREREEPTGILEDLVKELDFQERLTEEEKKLFSVPPAISQLFPDQRKLLDDEIEVSGAPLAETEKNGDARKDILLEHLRLLEEEAELLIQTKKALEERQGGLGNSIPDNWIPRPFEGRMTYIVPLIETPETRAFSKLQTVPAIMRSKVLGED